MTYSFTTFYVNHMTCFTCISCLPLIHLSSTCPLVSVPGVNNHISHTKTSSSATTAPCNRREAHLNTMLCCGSCSVVSQPFFSASSAVMCAYDCSIFNQLIFFICRVHFSAAADDHWMLGRATCSIHSWWRIRETYAKEFTNLPSWSKQTLMTASVGMTPEAFRAVAVAPPAPRLLTSAVLHLLCMNSWSFNGF
jgi:hypothetical protein